jgi:hypothetical protein
MHTGLTTDVLKQTLAEVERDEAAGICILVRLLDNVRETSNTAPLETISKVVLQWQQRPPNAIVSDLMKIAEQFEAECRTCAKK